MARNECVLRVTLRYIIALIAYRIPTSVGDTA